MGKLPVALVVPGNRHHRSRAVLHEHKIRHPYRERLAGQRMRNFNGRLDAGFFHRRKFGFSGGGLFAFVDKCRHFFIGRRSQLRKRMFRSHRDVGGTEQRIRACRIDGE